MKKTLLTKKIALLLCFLLAVGALSACSGGGKPAKNDAGGGSGGDTSGLFTPVGEYPIANEPIEMTMFSMSAPNIIDWATNDFTKYMEEKTNIKWNFVQAPNDASKEKINLLLSSGDYPDAFMFKTPDVSQYGISEGILVPLEDMIAQNMPNYWSYMEENPANWTMQRQADGHVYGVASINVCYHCRYYEKMWVNMDYIEEIGLGVPTTTEEFKAVCAKFLELYPKGVAVTGSTDGWGEQFINFLSGSFITNPGLRTAKDKLLVSPQGKVVTQASQDEYREYLRFMNELYKMGAIYDGGFTQNPDQYRSLVNQPDAPCLFIASGAICNSVDAETNPSLYKAFRAIAPLKGPDGTQTCTEFKYNDIIENKFVLTDKCKYPEAALRWADTFYTMEGYLRYQYGDNLNGTDYLLDPPGMVGLNGEPALYQVLNAYTAEAQNHDWQDCGLIFAPEYIRFGEATDAGVDIASAAGLEKLLLIETKEKCEPYAQNPATQFDVIPNRVKMTAEEASSIQTIAVELAKYIDENTIAFINGTKNIDSDWDAYIAGYDNIGLPKYLEVYQTAWDRQNGK